MPLRLHPLPAEGPAHVRDRIRKLPISNNHPLVNGVVFDTQNLNQPHAVYTLEVKSFASGKCLDDSVRYCGYRYLVNAAGQPYLAAEVHRHPHIPGQHDVHLNIGPFVGATAQALSQLAGRIEVQGGSFEARLLRCFPLYIMAIWLKSDNNGGDYIYPLQGGAPPPFQAGQLYSTSDFQNNIQSILQQRQNNNTK